MRRNLIPYVCVGIMSLSCIGPVYPFGEDVLARFGEYTFFINPHPGSHVTYYQKMVPCIEQKTIPVPRRVFQTYPVPVPNPRRQPIIISETPVGHAKGVGRCVHCFPMPSVASGSKEVIVPRMVPMNVPDVVVQPRCVTKRIMLPQWFAVQEHPKPPRIKVRNVAAGG